LKKCFERRVVLLRRSKEADRRRILWIRRGSADAEVPRPGGAAAE
jgi:hypothetical protein